MRSGIHAPGGLKSPCGARKRIRLCMASAPRARVDASDSPAPARGERRERHDQLGVRDRPLPGRGHQHPGHARQSRDNRDHDHAVFFDTLDESRKFKSKSCPSPFVIDSSFYMRSQPRT